MTIENNDEKNSISIGLMVTREDLTTSPLIPKEVLEDVEEAPYYLFIFISREDVIKISAFPSKNDKIKKILIKLKEFSPDLVKGISGILKELDLSKNILHTTGLCYEMENCFYETYLSGDEFESGKISVDSVKENFMSVAKVISVEIVDIPRLS